MKIKTNRQKWQELKSIIENKNREYLMSIFGKALPTKFFQAGVYEIESFSINEIEVQGINEPRLYGEIPTNKDIKKLREYLNNYNNEEKEIYFHWIKKEEYGTVRSAEKFSNFIENNKTDKGNVRFSLNRKKLISIQKVLNEKYGEKEGYKPCAYCGKQVPEKDLIPHTIIFQDHDNFGRRFVNKQTYMYCSGQCGANDQMAHEG